MILRHWKILHQKYWRNKETLQKQIQSINTNKKEAQDLLNAERNVDPNTMQVRLKEIDNDLTSIKAKGEEFSARLKETELSEQQRKIVEQQENISDVVRLENTIAAQKQKLNDHKSSLFFKNDAIQKAKAKNAMADTEPYTYEYYMKNSSGKWESPMRRQNVQNAMRNEKETIEHYQQIENAVPKLENEIESNSRKLRELKLKRANQYFGEELNETQLKTFEKFKKEVRFNEMNVADQQDLLLKMHDIHERNNGVNKVLIGKKRDLVDLQTDLKERLIESGQDPKKAEKIAKLQVRALASKDNKILGANPTQYSQRYTDDVLPALKNEFKADPTKAIPLKNEYLELLDKRNTLLKEFSSNPAAKKSIKEIDKDIENIETLYPKKAELDQIKVDYKNGKSAEIKSAQEAREAERVKSEAQAKAAKEAQEKEKQKLLAKRNIAQEESRKTMFQTNNATYASVKSNYNASDMQEWSKLMRENNVAPAAGEMDSFVKDAQRYLKSTKGEAKIETAENVVAVLSNSKVVSKSTDVDSFTSFVDMIKDPNMPSQSKIVEAMDKHFDYVNIGKKLNANQISDLRSVAEYSKDEATRAAAKNILIKMKKYYNQ